MTECPSCRIPYESQPKVCENCGDQFASDLKDITGSRTKKLTPSQAGSGWLLAMATIGALVMLGHFAAPSFADEQRKIPEPATPDVFYRLNSGALLPLERQVAVARGKVSGVFVKTTKGRLEFAGARSPIRFTSRPLLEFVVLPPPGVAASY